MRARIIFFILLAALLGACANPPPLPITPLPAVTNSAPAAAAEKIPVMQLTAQSAVDTNPGAQAVIRFQAEPMYLENGKTASGATYTSLSKWDNADITEMRVCMDFDQPCVPDGAWTTYTPEWSTAVNANWLGERTLWLNAEYRDRSGKTIPAYNASNVSGQPDSGATKVVISSSVDERTPAAAQPVFVQTAVAATRTAYPVTGSLVLQNGGCCAGGKIGAKIEIKAAFEASSPNTTVTEMRLLSHCGTQDEMNTAPWEPFVKEKIFPYTISVGNWIGWYLAVQYRDANGNLSPIYCDDISIEGLPQ